jgi:hypothetical protein
MSRGTGIMTVLADWPYVPLLAEVQKEIDCVRQPYVAFALCTPTSIMPADRAKAPHAPEPAPSRFGLPARR